MKINLIGILLILLLTSASIFTVYYKNTQQQILTLEQARITLEVAVQQQQAAIQQIQTSYKLQTSRLMTLASANSDLNLEKDILVNKLIKHDLEELSRHKPILVETRINNGTKELFSSFMSITAQ
jgi:hypothetical protein